MFQKQIRMDSDTYLKWVRTLCSVLPREPHDMTGVVAHHLIGHARCSSSKNDDLFAFPLTDLQHKILHDSGWREWERNHGSQCDYVLQTIRQAVQEGVIEIKFNKVRGLQ